MTSYEIYALSQWIINFLNELYPADKDINTFARKTIDEYRRKTALFRVRSAAYELSIGLVDLSEEKQKEERDEKIHCKSIEKG